MTRRALGPERVPEILTTRRQRTEREQTIVALLRERRAKEALDMKRADGTAIMVEGGYRETIAETVKKVRRTSPRNRGSAGHRHAHEPGCPRNQPCDPCRAEGDGPDRA